MNATKKKLEERTHSIHNILSADFGAIRSQIWYMQQVTRSRPYDTFHVMALCSSKTYSRTCCERSERIVYALTKYEKNHNWIWCIRWCWLDFSMGRTAYKFRTSVGRHDDWMYGTNNRAAVSWLQTSKYGQNVLLKMTGRSFHRIIVSLALLSSSISIFQLAFERDVAFLKPLVFAFNCCDTILQYWLWRLGVRGTVMRQHLSRTCLLFLFAINFAN